DRLIRQVNIDAIFLAGPGHGGPALIANVWLEGTWSEIYPDVSRDGEGMKLLFRQFSTPYGVPSHVSPPVPGSIHEGGELGYVLTHAFGAAFDNPDLVVMAVVGDGEAETGPLEGSWKGISFLNPARDGAVLPVLHLNGYKIANPTVLARKGDEEVGWLLRGHGYDPFFVVGDDPARVHAALAERLEAWMKSYRPQELFDDSGAPRDFLGDLAPRGQKRMSASSHANGGRVLVPLELPDYTEYAVEVKAPATVRHESVRQLGAMLRDVFAKNQRQQNFRLFCPDELTSNRLGAVLESTERCWVEQRLAGDDHLAADGRVMEVLSEHNCEGWLEGYVLTG